MAVYDAMLELKHQLTEALKTTTVANTTNARAVLGQITRIINEFQQGDHDYAVKLSIPILRHVGWLKE